MIRLVAVAFAVVLLSTVACKSKGTTTIDIEFGECAGRDDATLVRVYLIEGASCAGCDCSGGCFDQCGPDNCTVACDGEFCDVAEIESGLSLPEVSAGLHAVVFEYSYIDPATGLARVGATACAELVLDADGVNDSTQSADTDCCTNAADAGVP